MKEEEASRENSLFFPCSFFEVLAQMGRKVFGFNYFFQCVPFSSFFWLERAPESSDEEK